MRRHWKRILHSCALPLLMLTSAVSLQGCESWREEFQLGEATKAAEAAVKPAPTASPSGPKLPDLPATIKTCLLKQACVKDGVAKGECKTADGIVIEHVQSEKEKQSCARSMIDWYRKQQVIQANAEKDRHPASGKAAKKADWP